MRDTEFESAERGGLVYSARRVGFMGHAPIRGIAECGPGLCFLGVRTSKARVLWLMRVAQLQAPSGTLPKPEDPHAGEGGFSIPI
jgi:hypothetical protein